MSTPDIWEAKYVPISSSETTVEEKEGMAKAMKKLAERKFASFEKEMNGMLERTYYEEGDSNIVKEKKKRNGYFHRQVQGSYLLAGEFLLRGKRSKEN